MTDQGTYWLEARDKPGLLSAMMNKLAGDAHISFEGNLSSCNFLGVRGTTGEEVHGLKRQTSFPRLDFAVMPLDPDTVKPILQQILTGGRVVHDVVHVQIAKHGQLVFGAYDNFHPDCIFAGPGIAETLLQELVTRGILKSFEVAKERGV